MLPFENNSLCQHEDENHLALSSCFTQNILEYDPGTLSWSPVFQSLGLSEQHTLDLNTDLQRKESCYCLLNPALGFPFIALYFSVNGKLFEKYRWSRKVWGI